LKDGFITIKYLRIRPFDVFFGPDYTEKAQGLTRYYRQQYAKFKEINETTRFFRERLTYNYIYKGPVLEWYLRVKIRMENDYRTFHELLPGRGRILDIGCGYGFMSYMLQFASQERELLGYDHDEEKIAVVADAAGLAKVTIPGSLS
jgi:2-polyprenyl-3-methyl-5-hydroxy-6-metoxy-1,4-benzoquinol methylase